MKRKFIDPDGELSAKLDSMCAERDRLKAANAEMLAALKRTHVLIQRLAVMGADVKFQGDLCSIAHYALYHDKIIKAAIAKAEGL